MAHRSGIETTLLYMVSFLWLLTGGFAMTRQEAQELKAKLERVKRNVDDANIRVIETSNTLTAKAETGLSLPTPTPRPTTTTPDAGPTGYTERGDTLYKAFQTSLNQPGAAQTCQDDGGHLVVIKTQALKDFILGIMPAQTNYWIGIDDKDTEGTYMWADGTRVDSCDFDDWAPYEPNDNYGRFGGQDCVHMWHQSSYRWDDDECWKTKYFICQIGPGETCGGSDDQAEDCQVGNGASYRGNVAVTNTGRTCQRWNSQSPHRHDRTPANFPSSGLEQNYCRNPDGTSGAWCYTTDPSSRWELCDLPQCASAQLVRDDGRCGSSFPAPDANPGQCDPNSESPCCSQWGYCGASYYHCQYGGIDYRNT